MGNIANALIYSGPTKNDKPQTVPSLAELAAAKLERCNDDSPHNWAGESKGGIVYTLMFSETFSSFTIELLGYGARRYRPHDLGELQALLDELDHQIERYGDLQ